MAVFLLEKHLSLCPNLSVCKWERTCALVGTHPCVGRKIALLLLEKHLSLCPNMSVCKWECISALVRTHLCVSVNASVRWCEHICGFMGTHLCFRANAPVRSFVFNGFQYFRHHASKAVYYRYFTWPTLSIKWPRPLLEYGSTTVSRFTSSVPIHPGWWYIVHSLFYYGRMRINRKVMYFDTCLWPFWCLERKKERKKVFTVEFPFASLSQSKGYLLLLAGPCSTHVYNCLSSLLSIYLYVHTNLK